MERYTLLDIIDEYDSITECETLNIEGMIKLAEALDIFGRPASAEWVRRNYAKLRQNIEKEYSDVTNARP